VQTLENLVLQGLLERFLKKSNLWISEPYFSPKPIYEYLYFFL
jgi:hypothetical protein